MIDFIQNCLDGVAVGALYAMLAVAFTVIFGALRRPNLAFGPAIMFGVYAAVWLRLETGAALPLLLLTAVGGSVLAGLYVERLCFAPHRSAPAATSMVASFAVWMQLEELATVLLPGHVYAFPTLHEGAVWRAGPLHLHAESVIVLCAAVASCAGIWVFLHRTRLGLRARAFVDNPRGAACCGISIGPVSIAVFALASAIGGVAGFLVASVHGQVTPMLGLWATLKGLLAMMLGGFGSLPGAILGGLGLGLLEAHAQWYLGPQQRDLLVYLLVFTLLALRAPWMTMRSA